jgi:UDP-N-acetylglucosamine:LPS N-acetylglucosamine transferase
VKNNCTYWNNLSGKELQKIIEESNLIICRSGYSSIMDLAILGKKAVFVPTPGQTEQIYLAERLKEMNIAFSIQQNYFSLTKALDESKKFKGFSTYIPDNTILNERLKSLHE